MVLGYAFFFAPWVILLVGYPFYTLAVAIDNRALRRALGVLLVGVAPALFVAQVVLLAANWDSS